MLFAPLGVSLVMKTLEDKWYVIKFTIFGERLSFIVYVCYPCIQSVLTLYYCKVRNPLPFAWTFLPLINFQVTSQPCALHLHGEEPYNEAIANAMLIYLCRANCYCCCYCCCSSHRQCFRCCSFSYHRLHHLLPTQRKGMWQSRITDLCCYFEKLEPIVQCNLSFGYFT